MSVSIIPIPQLLTAGRISEILDERTSRVNYVLDSRLHIQPVARAGLLRLYKSSVIAQVRHEINAIDARKSKGRK
jgi:hypothetical protein